MRAAGRAMRAEQPQTELTSTRAVPGFCRASSTSSAVVSSVKPTSVRSRRIGTRNRSSYIVRVACGSPECVIFSWRLSVLIGHFLFIVSAHQREDRALRDDQVRLALEGDFDRGLPEEQRVVARLCLHWNKAVFTRTGAPRLVADLRRIGHRQTRTRRHDLSTLHCLAVHGSWRKIQPDLGALLPLLGLHEHPVSDDDQFLLWHSGNLTAVESATLEVGAHQHTATPIAQASPSTSAALAAVPRRPGPAACQLRACSSAVLVGQ